MWGALLIWRGGSKSTRQTGRGADFTKGHLPFKLVYTEEYPTLEEVYKRERQLHGWSRAKKDALILGDIEALKRLSKSKK